MGHCGAFRQLFAYAASMAATWFLLTAARQPQGEELQQPAANAQWTTQSSLVMQASVAPAGVRVVAATELAALVGGALATGATGAAELATELAGEGGATTTGAAELAALLAGAGGLGGGREGAEDDAQAARSSTKRRFMAPA
jgi:hypothetical protein